ncbi:MAG: FAD-dependent oxidoreductase [Psychrobacter sp.]|nr:FAD-dependent oxidoreductase [Psychrobacter sp.]
MSQAAAVSFAHANTPSTPSTSTLTTDCYTQASPSAGIVIIGAGMAGSRLAIELARAWQRQEADSLDAKGLGSQNLVSKTLVTNINKPSITLISKEAQVGYNRIMLSPVLAGETAFDDTYLYNESEYQQLGITVMAGVSVDSIDTEQRQVILDNGNTLGYSKLVFATGSTARVIPFPNHDAKGVHVFRDLADVQALTEYAKQGKSGLVIGGGVLGLEAACALATQGATMTVIHVDGYVLNRQLDLPAAELLQQELARRDVGLEVSAATETIQVNEAGEVTGLSLKDGRTLPADFIVMAVGVIPNTALAKQAGLEVNRGIVVDDCMHTSCENVYAIGECVELYEELFGMVAPVNQQVDTLITVLSQPQDNWQAFVSQPLSLKLKVSGVAVFSAGQIDFESEDRAQVETIVYRAPDSDHYQCLYIKDNQLVGAVLYGEVNEGSFYSQLINEQTDISAIKDDLIFGEAYCDLTTLKGNSTETLSPSLEDLSEAQAVDADMVKELA